MARMVLFVWGFYYIPVTGKPASFDEAPILVSNHVRYCAPCCTPLVACVNQTAVLRSSMFDALFFGYYELPRAISRKENLSLPFIGTRASPHARCSPGGL
jgi:hypothetical protein